MPLRIFRLSILQGGQLLTKCPKFIYDNNGGCKEVVLVLKIGHNRYCKRQRPSCAHFKFSGSIPSISKQVLFFGVSIMALKFRGNNDGPSIEEYIKFWKTKFPSSWEYAIWDNLQGIALLWHNSITLDKLYSNQEFEQLFLDKQAYAKKKENASPNIFSSSQFHRGVQSEIPKEAMWKDDESCKDARQKDKENINGLPPCGNSILQVFGFLQHEKVIVAIIPSCNKNFIKVNLDKILHIITKNIQSTQVDGENVQIFKDLKLTMDKYVLHFDFYDLDIEDVDVFLGYPLMDLVGPINLNVQNKILKLWYKKKKITLQNISLSKPAQSKGLHDAMSPRSLDVIPIDT